MTPRLPGAAAVIISALLVAAAIVLDARIVDLLEKIAA